MAWFKSCQNFFKSSFFKNILLILCSFLIGSFYTLHLIDSALIPTNVSWLLNGGEPSQHYLGWVFYRNDPNWHFPLSLTKYLLYPTGAAIGFTDSIPIVALFTKLFSGFLPEKFQYFGFCILLSLSLQSYFAIRIALILSRNNFILSLLSGLLMVQAPPLTWRLLGHIALTNQWVILCSIWLYLKEYQCYTARTVLGPRLCLVVIAGGIHPYLGAMTLGLLIASYCRFLLEKNCSLTQFINWTFATIAALLLSWFIFGYISDAATSSDEGFTIHSFNLLSIFNPMNNTSAILPPIKNAHEGQTEGYNYLGLGAILLLLTNLVYIRKSFRQIFSPSLLPITIVGILFFLFSLSTEITLGPFTLIAIGVPDFALNFLNVFRASGRMFWPAHYLILVGLLGVTFKYWHQWKTYIILFLVVCIQFVDLSPLRSDVRFWTNKPLESSPLIAQDWSQLNRNHSKLMVLPAYQCEGSDNTPGGRFDLFASLAAEQNLMTNSFYTAHLAKNQAEVHCKEIPDAVSAGILENDAAYILNQDLYLKMTSSGQMKSHDCSTVDDFILCRRKLNLDR